MLSVLVMVKKCPDVKTPGNNGSDLFLVLFSFMLDKCKCYCCFFWLKKEEGSRTDCTTKLELIHLFFFFFKDPLLVCKYTEHGKLRNPMGGMSRSSCAW